VPDIDRREGGDDTCQHWEGGTGSDGGRGWYLTMSGGRNSAWQ
jgi:hypothetical protein